MYLIHIYKSKCLFYKLPKHYWNAITSVCFSQTVRRHLKHSIAVDHKCILIYILLMAFTEFVLEITTQLHSSKNHCNTLHTSQTSPTFSKYSHNHSFSHIINEFGYNVTNDIGKDLPESLRHVYTFSLQQENMFMKCTPPYTLRLYNKIWVPRGTIFFSFLLQNIDCGFSLERVSTIYVLSKTFPTKLLFFYGIFRIFFGIVEITTT